MKRLVPVAFGKVRLPLLAMEVVPVCPAAKRLKRPTDENRLVDVALVVVPLVAVKFANETPPLKVCSLLQVFWSLSKVDDANVQVEVE